MLRGYLNHPTIRPTAASFVADFGSYASRDGAVAFNTVSRASEAPSAEDMMREMRRLAALLPPEDPEPPFGLGLPSLLPSGSVRIIEDQHMVTTIEDWSGVRSVSRAARRRRQGHRQNIRFVTIPKTEAYQVGSALVMHPAMAKAMRARLDGQIDALLGRSPSPIRSEGA